MAQPTRTFVIQLNESIVPFTKYKKKGFNGFQLSNGLWFNTRARITGSQIVQMEHARNLERMINELINGEARKLQNFWFTHVNKYFNRRSLGMHYYRGSRSGLIASTRSFRGRYTRRQQFKRREHTGQLRRALIIKNKSLFGCELFVRPCYAKTGSPVDYVNILMRGARAKPKPYIPILDKRINIPGRYWRGISSSYWAIWQAVFEKQVKAANTRINQRIEQYVISNKIIEKTDIRRARDVSPLQKKVTTIRKEAAIRPTTSTYIKSSPFNNPRWKNIFKRFE
jgi:hypothetical protein